ncbi:hypothetical protein LLEC1_07041 [Akanthomyces lecanii]|uniref:GTP-binding protein n=1 Tax=Cordyceps confragosa TaxID=2714763 RepID=A0A179I8U8_CORDF|nr:hypothetical protein LLEC1_07041 [Akanthomyces lecanii]
MAPKNEAKASDAAAPSAEPRLEVKKPKKKKVLLMGKSGSGKSSMRSIIFSNYIARDTRRLGATIDIDLSHVKFLGNLTLNLWDCGGQEAFMENYLSQQRVHVFSNVGVLIYVFDIESRDVDRDLATYVSILSALLQYSPAARIYILVHKMDLVVPASREAVYDERAEEILLFERTSFLAVSSWTSAEATRNPTEDRLERMSNIMKHFKQSISRFTGTPRNAEQFTRMEHKAGTRFSLFILKFTTNTYLMVVLPPGEGRFNAAMLNCQIAIEHFKFLDAPGGLPLSV